MTLFSYTIFDTVAHQGSFNRAAQQLHLTPSAISHAVAAMEQELGFALFHRSKSGVALTRNGETLYPAVRAVLNSDETLQQMVAQLNGMQKGRVRIGTFNSACTCLLPGILKEFSAQYPQIDVEVMQGTYSDILEWLRSGVVDLGFLSTSSAGGYPIEPLLKDPLCCVVPKGWPVPPEGVMTPEQMRGQRFVIQGEATDADIQNFLQKYKIETLSRCRVVDDMSNLAMVEAGIGIAIMPKLILQDCRAAVDIYPIVPQEYRVIGLAVQDASATAPAVCQMQAHILRYCRGKEQL
ncbi:MAG: LysR family transcriptional regulator [Faecalibacterium sp.]|jgi:DNA-binding transcriptional LysR family regulator|nr:LysR family transcriptional regulator [Faecalibacterium sp.]